MVNEESLYYDADQNLCVVDETSDNTKLKVQFVHIFLITYTLFLCQKIEAKDEPVDGKKLSDEELLERCMNEVFC